jgi:hypothetical protein
MYLDTDVEMDYQSRWLSCDPRIPLRCAEDNHLARTRYDFGLRCRLCLHLSRALALTSTLCVHAATPSLPTTQGGRIPSLRRHVLRRGPTGR